MSLLRNMPTAGAVVIVIILALFALSVVLLVLVNIRYRVLASRSTAEKGRYGEFHNVLLSEYTAAYRKFGQEVNTPAIISDVTGDCLGGLLFCERFLNNAVSLFVTLGLFGTFLGLSLSVVSLTNLIGLSNTSEWLSVLDSVGGGLMSALGGMGVAFYTSLVGAGCSIILTVLRTILSPQAERERLSTRLELWLDNEVAPTLATEYAKDEAGMMRVLTHAMNQATDAVKETLFKAADSYSAATRAAAASLDETAAQMQGVLTNFHETVGTFNNGVHDFSEVDYNLRGSIERMDLAVRDLANAFRDISRRMGGDH